MFERNWDPWLVSFALTWWASFARAFENCDGPTKIFLLAGQSNMVGMGSIEHMRKLLNDTETHAEYATYWNETSHDWAERDDIFVKFNDHIGYLRIGFGAAEDDGFFWPELVLDGHFGPELGMGWVLGDQMQNCGRRPIFFLKTAYGGRDLAIDFRPPSSGKGNYEGVKPMHYGWQYREMIDDILSTLADLENLVPGYDDDLGFELSGLVWFQGWNDMISEPKVQEYEYNLANLIRDMRDDLDAPMMPVLVGGMGQLGVNASGRGAERYYAMQRAELAVTLYEEFRNNTLYVPTAQFMDYPGNDTYNGGYHYDGRADVYTHIGRAFGQGILRLLGMGKKSTQNRTFQVEQNRTAQLRRM